jgi:hypothetical protein
VDRQAEDATIFVERSEESSDRSQTQGEPLWRAAKQVGRVSP